MENILDQIVAGDIKPSQLYMGPDKQKSGQYVDEIV